MFTSFAQDEFSGPAQAFQFLLNDAIERAELGRIQLLLISSPTFSQGTAEEQGQVLKSVMAFLNSSTTAVDYKETIEKILREKMVGMETESSRELFKHILAIQDNDVITFLHRWLKKECGGMVIKPYLDDEKMRQYAKHIRELLQASTDSAMHIPLPSISNAEMQSFFSTEEKKALIKQLTLASHSIFAPGDLAKLERKLGENTGLVGTSHNEQPPIDNRPSYLRLKNY